MQGCALVSTNWDFNDLYPALDSASSYEHTVHSFFSEWSYLSDSKGVWTSLKLLYTDYSGCYESQLHFNHWLLPNLHSGLVTSQHFRSADQFHIGVGN